MSAPAGHCPSRPPTRSDDHGSVGPRVRTTASSAWCYGPAPTIRMFDRAGSPAPVQELKLVADLMCKIALTQLLFPYPARVIDPGESTADAR